MVLTLEKYQQLEAINSDKTLNDIDKSLFSICAMYGLSEQQLDNYKPAKVKRMADKVSTLLSKPFAFKSQKYIGYYKVGYAIEEITFGKYIELVHFTKKNDILNKAHYITATMAETIYPKEHIDKANYFLKCDAEKVIGAALKIKSHFDNFNALKFKALFEPFPEMSNDNSFISEWFSNNFGWFFSAKSVAEFEGITLEQAYKLPVIRALNDLMFLKAKGRLDNYLATRKS